MRATILRKDFEKLLVNTPQLCDSDEAIAFDTETLKNMPIEKELIRRVFPFEVPPEHRRRLFPDGRRLFVCVKPLGTEAIQGLVFSVATDVLQSERAILPTTFHHYWRASKNLAAIVVSSVIDEIFGKNTHEKN